MRGLLAAAAAALLVVTAAAQSRVDLGADANVKERFVMRVVTKERVLDPWELLWGPDGQLWVTERSAKSIIRIDPATGAKTTLVTVDDAYRSDTQDGVLGLALHPDFGRGRGLDFVYTSFVYSASPGPPRVRRMRVRRYTYDARAGVLQAPVDLITDVPSYSDHAGGRLVMGRDRTLFLTVGDLAANHLGRPCEPNRAQDLPTAADVANHTWTTYQGKVLRLNLDGSVPADNPILAGVRSHVYSYGHRNPQGLAVGPSGLLYESEHGPNTDDELNLIAAGKNYGWPYVAGFADDRSYVYANWSAAAPAPCASLEFNSYGAPASVPQQKESAWKHPDFTAPLQTFFTVPDGYPFSQRGNPIIAPSGIDVYASSAIPGWGTSVLIGGLKGAIYRVKLGADGRTAVGAPFEYFVSGDRYRDLAFSPDGKTIFAGIDNWASRDHPGAILAFTYDGQK